MPDEFVAIRVVARSPAVAEQAVAEAHALGAAGLEEGGPPETPALVVYAPAAAAQTLRDGLAEALGEGARVGPAEAVPARDWSVAWKEGLGPIVISARLALRPPFAEHAPAAGQAVLVVEPGQAFGTGHHASTRLALALLDEALVERPGASVLDVGTGSGVLALAAAALGAAAAVGFDLDAVAVAEARRNLRANPGSAGVDLFVGGVEALAAERFDVVAANLLRSELVPILGALVAHLAEGGTLVLSGLLAADLPRLAPELERHGLTIAATRREGEGGDDWLGLRLARQRS
jgi:ribosomal protein L11 methyltransferase